ncbi:hypothetical protein Glove_273g17 [Diversispora epigaea]|uniref:Uncharacterized protein n=1 Tax=Diversispora epigaea TaxID=1348612 RepID=A0A397IA37_9GLOM|nr:hypothetical protein Glove_273g17 [Diversispora epigaea]
MNLKLLRDRLEIIFKKIDIKNNQIQPFFHLSLLLLKMPIGIKIADFAHKAVVITLVGTAVFGFVTVGMQLNRRLAKRKEWTTQKELEQLSQNEKLPIQNDNPSTT